MKQTILIVTISLLICLMIGGYIYFFYYFGNKFYRLRKAFAIAAKNTEYCGSETCNPEFLELDPPKTISKQWNKSQAYYAANLLLRLGYGKETNNIVPKDFDLIRSFYTKYGNIEVGFCNLMLNNEILYIVIRGITCPKDWVSAFQYSHGTWFSNSPNEQISYFDDKKILVHEGFMGLYKNFRKSFLSTIKKLKPKFKQIFLTGHSLGAAISSLIALDLYNNGYDVTTYVFGTPKVGNKEFADAIGKSSFFNVMNTSDETCNIPLSVSFNTDEPKNPFFYQHCGEKHYFTDNWKSIYLNHLIAVYIKNTKP